MISAHLPLALGLPLQNATKHPDHGQVMGRRNHETKIQWSSCSAVTTIRYPPRSLDTARH